jgi:hypothetical protein
MWYLSSTLNIKMYVMEITPVDVGYSTIYGCPMALRERIATPRMVDSTSTERRCVVFASMQRRFIPPEDDFYSVRLRCCTQRISMS